MSGTAQPMMKPMGRPMGSQPSGVGGMLTPQMASAARNMAAMGMGRDNMLAHINPREAQMLMQMGGKGNLNPATGLPQFDDTPSITIPTGGTPTPGFTPSSVPYTDLGGAQADNPFDTALYSSYGGSGPVAAGTAPIDPTLLNWVDSNIQSLSSSAGGGAQDPFLMAEAPGVGAEYSQFAATPGNPNFTVNSSGYADFTPQGAAAYNAYAGGAEQSIKANAANNEKGDMEGIMLALGLPAAVVGAGFGAEALLGADALGGVGAGAAGDVFDLGAAGTSIVPDAALGTAADPFAVGAAVTDATAGGIGDSFVGAGALADAGAGSSLAALGANPTLAELAAATPDSLVGDASAVTDASIGSGDAWDIPAAADSAASNATDLGVAPSTDLATIDSAQFPGGYIVPPDPTTGLTAGETAATAAAGGGPVAGGSGGGVGGWLSTLGDKGLAELSDPMKLLGLGATGVGLISSMSGQNKNVGNVGANENALNNLATQTGQTGAQLQSYLANGTLPPGLMQAVDTATQSAIQNIKAKYASNGMGVNSTPEAQDIAKIQANVPATIATIGQQLLQSGTADLQISQGTLQNLLTANTSLNNQTNQAIANLARALSGTGTTTTTTTH